MYYASTMFGTWFTFVGLCFLFISTRVTDTGNKMSFFSCGLFSLLVGLFPILVPSIFPDVKYK